MVKKDRISYKKSAKDLAFDKERSKLRHNIDVLEYEINKRDKQIRELQIEVSQKEEIIRNCVDTMTQLSELLKLSHEDLQVLLESKKTAAKLEHIMSPILNSLSKSSIGYPGF